MKWSKRIREWRLSTLNERGKPLRQGELTERVRALGFRGAWGQSRISNYEKGKPEPGPEAILAIAIALGKESEIGSLELVKLVGGMGPRQQQAVALLVHLLLTAPQAEQEDLTDQILELVNAPRPWEPSESE